MRWSIVFTRDHSHSSMHSGVTVLFRNHLWLCIVMRRSHPYSSFLTWIIALTNVIYIFFIVEETVVGLSYLIVILLIFIRNGGYVLYAFMVKQYSCFSVPLHHLWWDEQFLTIPSKKLCRDHLPSGITTYTKLLTANYTHVFAFHALSFPCLPVITQML